MNRIRKVQSIEGISAFSDCEWEASEAGRFNLIYGWNGSGKTTIARVLRFIEQGAINLPGFSELQYRLKTDGGTVSRNDLGNEGLEIRVFNDEFIDDNLSFKQSKAEPIIILGQDNVIVEKEIDNLTEQVQEAREECEVLQDKIDDLPNPEQILTDCGRRVTQEFAGTQFASERYDSRRYTRTQVQELMENKKLEEETVDGFIIEDETHLRTLRDEINSERSALAVPEVKTQGARSILEEGNKLLQLRVQSEAIERLENDDQLREWVREGYELHEDREVKTCLFCDSHLDSDILDIYGRVFTDAVSSAEARIEEVLGNVLTVKKELELDLPDSHELFPDLRDRYVKAKEKIESCIEDVASSCEMMEARLRARQGRVGQKNSRQEKVEIPNDSLDDVPRWIERIEMLLTEHNERVEDIEERAVSAADEIEVHLVASLLSERKYFKFRKKRNELEDELKEALERIEAYGRQIKDKKAQIEDAALAVERINSVIARFIGEGEIELQVSEQDDDDGSGGPIGYRVTRRGKATRYLSDGERSVVALAYFLVSLQAADCELEETTVVLDDPVDSQDAVFLFKTFGLLRSVLSDAGQLFLLTHNYELFNVVRDWLTHDRFKNESCLFRIRMDREGEDAHVSVSELPDLLRDYKTEYQFLVSQMHDYCEGASTASGPMMANIARKVLEHFAAFKWSCTTHDRFNEIVQNKFIRDENRRKSGVGSAVVKFLHEYSHGEDFGRPVSASVMEAESICENVLEFIYWADKEHYDEIIKDIEE